MTDRSSNGYNGDKLNGLLSEIAKIDDELASMKGEYMQAWGPRSRIKDILATAKESDINMVAFRVLLAKHRDERKHERRAEGLEADDRSVLDVMLAALGEYADTPLGQAAIASVG